MTTCSVYTGFDLSGQCSCGAELQGNCHILRENGVPADLLCGNCCNCCLIHGLKLWPTAAETIAGEQLELV